MAHRKKDIKEKERGQYSRETLKEAVRRILNGELSVQIASTKYSIPERTLQRHVQ